MVWVRLRGGLGNQLFQYATARALASEQDSRVRLDCSYYEVKKKRQFELDAYSIHASVCSPLETSIEQMWRRLVPFYAPRVWQEKSAAFDPELLRIRGSVILEGFFQSEKYFRTLRNQLYAEIQPRPGSMDGRLLSLTGRIRSPSSVCVHVRRGDYVTSRHNRMRFGLLSPDYFLSAAIRIRAHVSSPEFFVFSDDSDWALRHIVPSLGPGAQAAPPADGHAHFALMRACRHHIVANSSFSWWTAWLADQPGGMVVAPMPWFRVDSGPDIVCDHWHRVAAQFEEP